MHEYICILGDYDAKNREEEKENTLTRVTENERKVFVIILMRVEKGKY